MNVTKQIIPTALVRPYSRDDIATDPVAQDLENLTTQIAGYSQRAAGLGLSLPNAPVPLDQVPSAPLTSVTLSPSDVSWQSSDPTVATVVNGLITGVKTGSATVTLGYGGRTAVIAVTVTVADPVPIVLTGASFVVDCLNCTPFNGSLASDIQITVSFNNVTEPGGHIHMITYSGSYVGTGDYPVPGGQRGTIQYTQGLWFGGQGSNNPSQTRKITYVSAAGVVSNEIVLIVPRGSML